MLLALLLGAGAAEAAAQVRRGRAVERPPRWAPVAVGARFGYDQSAQGEVLGVQLRIPIVRSGVVEFTPGVDRILVPGTSETQYTLGLDYVPGRLQGGVILGGGITWRDSVVGGGIGDPRTTFFGYTALLGGKTNFGRLQLEIGLRWTFLNDTQYQPQSATLGLNFPFWRVVPGGS